MSLKEEIHSLIETTDDPLVLEAVKSILSTDSEVIGYRWDGTAIGTGDHRQQLDRTHTAHQEGKTIPQAHFAKQRK